MKILVTNNTFNTPGGSETYAYAVIAELVRQGHTVHAFTKGPLGMIANQIKKLGVPVVNRIPNTTYDYVLASHTSTIPDVLKLKDSFKIQTCHGIYPPLEQPYKGMDAYVSISQEVHTHLKNKGFDSTVIYNGVDTNRFSPSNPVNDTPKVLLSLAQGSRANAVIADACKKLGISLLYYHKLKKAVFDINSYIDKADIVVTLGRGAYESMSGGRNVIVYDERGYSKLPPVGDGLMTPDSIETSLTCNCSGRATKVKFNAATLIDHIKKCTPQNAEWSREYALENFNITTQLEKYFALKS